MQFNGYRDSHQTTLGMHKLGLTSNLTHNHWLMSANQKLRCYLQQAINDT